MNINPIRSEADHRAALKEIEGLMSARMDTPDGDRLDILATLVEAYEAKHFFAEPIDPIDAIKFALDQKGLTLRDLQPMIGGLNRVYEVMNGTRALTLPMIRRLHAGLGIPVATLIKPRKLVDQGT
jgi:HTH-type transcriptional regulator/antitoxin HigA